MTADVQSEHGASPRLVPLSLARLAGNGLFRFVYPFLGLVAADVGLGEGAETLLIAGLAGGGMLMPFASRRLLGDQDAPRRATTVGLATLCLGTVLLGGLAPSLATAAGVLGTAVALVAMVVLGLAKPLLDIGSMTYVSARVPWRRRGRALSVMELTWAGGLLVLAPVGLLADAVGWRVTIVLLGLVSLAAIPLLRHWLAPDEATAALAATRPPEDALGAPTESPTSTDPVRGDAPPTVVAAPPTSEAAPATEPSARRGSAWRFLVVFALVFVALETTFGVVGLWLEDVRGVDAALVASLTAIGGMGELAGSLFTVAVADRIGKARTAGLGLVACAAGFGVLGTAGPLWLAVGGLVVGLFGTETAIVAGIPLASEVEPGRRAAFLSRAVASASAARATTVAGAALLLRRGGIVANTSVSVVAALVALAMLVMLVRRDPRLRG